MGNVLGEKDMNTNEARLNFDYSNKLLTPQNNCMQKQDLTNNFD